MPVISSGLPFRIRLMRDGPAIPRCENDRFRAPHSTKFAEPITFRARLRLRLFSQTMTTRSGSL